MNDLVKRFSIWNLIFPLLFLITFSSADIVWEENFDDPLIDQKGATGSSGGAVVDMNGITNWNIDITVATLSATSDWFRVDGKAFDAHDVDGEAIWESEVINISGLSDVTFSLDVSEQGTLEGEGSGVNTDYFDVYYNVDNAGYVKISNLQGTTGTTHTLVDDWDSINISQSIGSGHTSVQLKFVMRNSAGDEHIIFDNVLVETSTVLPVTISQVYPERYGNTLDITFGTATETGNLGFNVYAVKGKGEKKKWIKLNDELIPGALDSFEPQDYHASVEIAEGLKVKKIGIAGVDVNGKEDRHGPFKIGKQSGEKTVAVPVDWGKVQKEVKKDKKARKAKRKARKVAKGETRQTLKNEVVTLQVSEKAVYLITHEDLVAKGVDLRGFKTDKIAISFKGEGVARHIEGLNKREKWTKNSAIEFMGEAPNNKDALYIKANQYRLSLNKELVVESEPIEALTTKEIVVDQNKNYSYTMPLNDPFYEAFFHTLNAEAIAEYSSSFDMPFTPQEGESKLSIHAAVTTKGTHRMDVTLNGTTIANTTAQDRSTWIIDTMIDNALLQEVDNTLAFKLYGEDDGLDIVAYDKLVISYDTGEAIASLTPTIELNDKIRKKDIRVKKGTNYLMITHPLFMNETLESYVETREGEGWKIEVVNVEDIYSAYTTGMPLPQAIQTYIDESSQRGVTHVQLIGASNYDNNDYLGYGALSLIPTVYTLTSEYVKYTPSDASYILGDDNLPIVAIGRWPVHTQEEFENIINKTLNWQTTANALLITDEIDQKGTDFKPQMMKMATKMQSDGYTIQEVHLDDYNTQYHEDAVETARADIQQSMQNASIVSYNGHGSPIKWSQKGLVKQEDIANIPNSTSTPIVLPFTCMSTYTDSASINTMPHQLLVAGENGAVAIYGATVYSSYGDNGIIIAKVFNYLSKGQTLGEAIMNSKLELGVGYLDVIRGANLIGDVSLRMK